MSLVVVGSVAFDSIKTQNDAVEEALGGSAVHFSLSSRFFAPTHLVGVVGADFRDDYRDLLADRGIGLAGLETVPDGKTFRWSGEYAEDMNHRETLEVHLNVLEAFAPKLPAGYRKSPFVFLANGAPATQASVLDQMENTPFVMADTMDLWIQIARDELEAVLRRVDGLVLNDQEAAMLTGHQDIIRAAAEIVEMFELNTLIVKKGEHGCLVARQGQRINLPAYPLLKLTDPTGAGDSFAGGLLGYMASAGDTSMETFKRAVAWGTVAASFCCEGFGVQRLAELEKAELDARFEEYRRMLEL